MNEQMRAYNKVISSVSFELMPVSNLVLDEDGKKYLEICRDQHPRKPVHLAQLYPIKVIKRGGVYHAMSEHLPIEDLALILYSRGTPVWCMVYDGSGESL